MYVIKLKRSSHSMTVKHVTRNVSLKHVGRRGPKGDPGDPIIGLPSGGLTRQFLAKSSDVDYATMWATLNKADVGLGNVNDTADTDKPISDATRDALALKSRKMIIDANEHGIVADGVTDDAPAWNALLASCSAGDVITWTGNSILRDSILWNKDVSLVGQGWGRSILSPTDDVGSPHYFAAIRSTVGEGRTSSNPLRNSTFKDFRIDGYGLHGSTYTVAAKGIWIQYAVNCQWLNLYVHDTIASGLGIDFLPGCVIDGNVGIRCGRLAVPGVDVGGAAIGIGTGGFFYEPLTITNNYTEDSGLWGIFVESQFGIFPAGQGNIIDHNTSFRDFVGIADVGTVGTKITNNFVKESKKYGILVKADSKGGLIDGNHVYDTVNNGIFLDGGTNNYKVSRNYIEGAGKQGIKVFPYAPKSCNNVSVVDNFVTNCANQGISVIGESTICNYLEVSRNRIWNNGQANDPFDDGIQLGGFATAINMSVNGNTIYDDQTVPTQGAAIHVTGNVTYPTVILNATIADNNLQGSVTRLSITDPFTTLTTPIIRDNKGVSTDTISVLKAGDTMTGPLVVTSVKTPDVNSNATNGTTRIFGGIINDGAGIVFGGSTNATIPNKAIARISGTDIWYFDSTGINVTGQLKVSDRIGVGTGAFTLAAPFTSAAGLATVDTEAFRFNRISDDLRYSSIFAKSDTGGNATVSFRVHDGVTTVSQRVALTLWGSGRVDVPVLLTAATVQTPSVLSNDATGLVRLSGGPVNDGAVMLLAGSTHATLAGKALMRVGSTEVAYWDSTGVGIRDGKNIILDTTTGTKIGTAATQKLSFWNATPVVQPTTSTSAATRVGGGGTTLTDSDTFDGYTLAKVVKALRNIGILA